MSRRTSQRGRVVMFDPVRTTDTNCSICGDDIKRAVMVSLVGVKAQHYFCRPCVRRAARAADFKPVEHVQPKRTKRVGAIANEPEVMS